MSLPEPGSSTLQLNLHQQRMHQAAQWPQVTHCSACLHLEATGIAGRAPQQRGVNQKQIIQSRLQGTVWVPHNYSIIIENRTKNPPRYKVKAQTCQHQCCPTQALLRHWAAAWLELLSPFAFTQCQGSSAEQAGHWASPVWAEGSLEMPGSGGKHSKPWSLGRGSVLDPGQQQGSPGPQAEGQPWTPGSSRTAPDPGQQQGSLLTEGSHCQRPTEHPNGSISRPPRAGQTHGHSLIPQGKKYCIAEENLPARARLGVTMLPPRPDSNETRPLLAEHG